MSQKLEIVVKGASPAAPLSAGSNIPGGVLARVSGAVQGALDGWFGPGKPLPPAAPPGTPVRAFDFPYGINLETTTRPYAPIPHEDLRRFARNYPLMRFAIEKLKDRICAKEWTIQPVSVPNEKPADFQTRAQNDPRIPALIAGFKRPDGENPWRRWLRKLLEDYLVIDAGSISVQRTRIGGVYRFLVIDGASIVRKVDLQGMTPQGPTDVAYQQIIKGLPAIDLAKRDLLYAAENTPSYGLYGYSRVEQAVQLAVLGMNRLIHQTNYYTEGSVPDVFAFLPEGTTPEESLRWDAMFQKIMSGQSAARRKVWWMPWTGKEPTQMKAQDLTDKMDEMLNRMICWVFGLSPSAIVPQVNRAAAGQMADDADEAGETPVSEWVCDTINELIQSPQYLNCPDLEFAFVEQSEVDNLVQKQIDQIDFAMGAATGNGITVLNEIRDREGKPQLEDLTPDPTLEAQATQDGDNDKPEDPPRKRLDRQKSTGGSLTIDPGKDTPAKAKAQKALAGALTSFLAAQSKVLAASVSSAYLRKKAETPARTKAEQGSDDGKDDDLADTAESIVDTAGLDWSELPGLIDTFLQHAALSGVAEAGTSLGIAHDIFSQANEWAIGYANDRAAELVGMKWIDGKLVENPNAQWAITDTTRARLQQLVVKALEEGTPVRDLKAQIEDSTLFSPVRAEMIATTEVNFANSGGQYEVAKLVGHTAKRSILSGDHDLDDDCDENADASSGPDGIPFTEPFPSGDLYGPFHPNCVCLTVTFTPGEEL